MKRLKTNKHMLHVLKNCKANVRKIIIKNAPAEFIKTLCEICMNVLNGNLKISKKCKDKVKFYKKTLRDLASKKFKIKTKKKILVQKGGAFLPILIGALLSSVIGKVLDATI